MEVLPEAKHTKALVFVFFATIFLSDFVLPFQLNSFGLDPFCGIVLNFNSSVDEKNDMEVIHEACEKVSFKSDDELGDKGQSQKLDHDCFTKCYLEKLEFFLKNGTFNPKAVQNLYETFSNASTDYISRISTFHEICVVSAMERIKTLEQNGTAITECTFFGEFDYCIGEQVIETVVHSFGNSSVNICGDDDITINDDDDTKMQHLNLELE